MVDISIVLFQNTNQIYYSYHLVKLVIYHSYIIYIYPLVN